LFKDVLASSSRDLDTKTYCAVNDTLTDNVFLSIPTFVRVIPRKPRTELDKLHPEAESNVDDLLKIYYPTDWYNDYLDKIKILYDILKGNKIENRMSCP
jgi:hypothetical protein